MNRMSIAMVIQSKKIQSICGTLSERETKILVQWNESLL